MHIVARTDIGLVRKRNEDFYIVAPEQDLVVLCDGMGGHPGGDLASKMAAEEVHRAVTENTDGAFSVGDSAEATRLQPFLPLVRGVFSADRKLRAYGRRHAQYQGMGTTLAALQEHAGHVCAVHVGDSRVYCLRGGELIQLTMDHSVVAGMPESARASCAGMRNILTRAVGVGEEFEVDFTIASAQPDELYMLCTDGLHNFVTEDRIVEVLTSNADREECVRTLIEDANLGGGGDNVTLALAWITARPAQAQSRLSGVVTGDSSSLQIHFAT